MRASASHACLRTRLSALFLAVVAGLLVLPDRAADAAPKKRPAVSTKAKKPTPPKPKRAVAKKPPTPAKARKPAPAAAATTVAGAALAASADAASPPSTSQILAPKAPFGFPEAPLLAAALDAVTADKYEEAVTLAEQAPLLDRQIVSWLIARAPNSRLSLDQTLAIRDSHAGWPEPDRLTVRAEYAFLQSLPLADTALAYFSQTPPITAAGKRALLRGLVNAGREAEARALVSATWRSDRMTIAEAARIEGSHGYLLTPEDREARFFRLMEAGEMKAAIADAAAMGEGFADLVRAVSAAFAERREAASLLSKVEPHLRDRPEYRLAMVAVTISAKRFEEAAMMLLLTPPPMELAGGAPRWFALRHDLTRALSEGGKPDLAFRIASRPVRGSPRIMANAAFDAGFYALRFLNDPISAVAHFERMAAVAPDRRLKARAGYWLGRASEAAQNALAASLAYSQAAEFGETFFGQLARERRGLVTTGLERAPEPTAAERLAFRERIEVRVIERLAAAGHIRRTDLFFAQLARKVKTPGGVALTVALARRIGRERLVLDIVKTAAAHGVEAAGLHAPLIAIPHRTVVTEPVDRAVVFAVARQESSFNTGAKSPVGARGLMQLMPGTARETARLMGRPYMPEALTADPAYNATLGAAYLRRVLRSLGGSWVMTFAGYNAGPSRPKAWVASIGDPRGAADPVDWIERIPFDETRNYVERVMEHMQGYRSRLGSPLSIGADLRRGEPQT